MKLTQKLGLDRPLVLVCMKLHNLCLENLVDLPSHRFLDDVRNSNEWIIQDNECPDDAE